jgi:uncharacterized radical SAM superfamily protein
MPELSPETVWQMKENELLDILDRRAFLSKKPRNIRFYAPSFMYYKTSRYCSTPNDFPTISITGKGCALNCKHCAGTILGTMLPATTPEKLFTLCIQLKNKGAVGCLISGGCQPDGSVPLNKFIGAINKVKTQLGLTVFVHTGIINLNTAEALRRANVDAALTDIIGSDETIKQIYNLNITVQDYAESLSALDKSGIKFVPHVIAGIHYGKLRGELHALQMIAKTKPSAIVIIAFMPIRGTEMKDTEPAKPAEIAKVTAVARLMFPRTPLVLGCMRPRGRHQVETDILAIKSGVDAIAFPSEEAIKYAEDRGYSTSFSSLCCSQIYADM